MFLVHHAPTRRDAPGDATASNRHHLLFCPLTSPHLTSPLLASRPPALPSRHWRTADHSLPTASAQDEPGCRTRPPARISGRPSLRAPPSPGKDPLSPFHVFASRVGRVFASRVGRVGRFSSTLDPNRLLSRPRPNPRSRSKCLPVVPDVVVSCLSSRLFSIRPFSSLVTAAQVSHMSHVSRVSLFSRPLSTLLVSCLSLLSPPLHSPRLVSLNKPRSEPSPAHAPPPRARAASPTSTGCSPAAANACRSTERPPTPTRPPPSPRCRRPSRRGRPSRQRDFCHSAAPPSPFVRCFNTDGDGLSAKSQNSRRRPGWLGSGCAGG